MKRLAIHLLRLGDLLMTAPVLEAIKAQYPDDELHLLINQQCMGALPLIKSYVDDVWFFDRGRIQQSIGNPDAPTLEAFDEIQMLVRQLNAQDFNEIINLTQNKISGRLTQMIKAPVKFGLSLDANEKAEFNSPWFGFLEGHIAGETRSLFHSTDILYFGAGLDGAARATELNVSESAKTIAHELLGTGQSQVVCYQTKASDIKKTLTSSQWNALIKSLGLRLPNSTHVLFAGPNEEQDVELLASTLRGAGIQAKMIQADLATTKAIIDRSVALVTVDTSVKHLAAGSPTKIIELAMGSSQPDFTGAYREDALIITSKEGCAPCKHSQPCNKERHLCGAAFEADLVSGLIAAWIKDDTVTVRALAANSKFTIGAYVTKISDLGFWTKIDLSQEVSVDDLDNLIEKISWKAFLDRAHLDQIGLLGTYTYRILEFLQKNTSRLKRQALATKLAKLEPKLASEADTIATLLGRLHEAARANGNQSMFSQFLVELEAYLIRSKWVRPLQEASREARSIVGRGEVVPFYIIRRIQSELNDCNIRTRSRIKICQMIRSNERMQNEQLNRP